MMKARRLIGIGTIDGIAPLLASNSSKSGAAVSASCGRREPRRPGTHYLSHGCEEAWRHASEIPLSQLSMSPVP